MATVTQQIPNYILGISDQPDELKLNGQVKDLQNAYPDITIGCTKRAGSRFIKKISYVYYYTGVLFIVILLSIISSIKCPFIIQKWFRLNLTESYVLYGLNFWFCS